MKILENHMKNQYHIKISIVEKYIIKKDIEFYLNYI